MHERVSFPSASTIRAGVRPRVRGKFLWVGDEKLYVRGVTYGTFRPDASGNQYHNRELTGRDFALMSANGINAVRVYHTPPSLTRRQLGNVPTARRTWRQFRLPGAVLDARARYSNVCQEGKGRIEQYRMEIW